MNAIAGPGNPLAGPYGPEIRLAPVGSGSTWRRAKSWLSRAAQPSPSGPDQPLGSAGERGLAGRWLCRNAGCNGKADLAGQTYHGKSGDCFVFAHALEAGRHNHRTLAAIGAWDRTRESPAAGRDRTTSHGLRIVGTIGSRSPKAMITVGFCELGKRSGVVYARTRHNQAARRTLSLHVSPW
jgi:hypothetical protein